jgi:hypothetical protein
VTTWLPQTRPHGNGTAVGRQNDALAAGTSAVGPTGPRARAGWFARHPEWPFVALLTAWPLWWALGIQTFAVPLLCIPCAWRLYRWRATGTRVIRTPPGFGLWLLFLLVMVAGLATIKLQAPGTLPSPVSNRVISWALRALTYAGVTALFLYAGNLTEKELPRRRLAWMLGLVGVYTVAGGILGTLLPRFTFKSPFAYLVPKSFQAAHGNLSSLYPSFAQIQNTLGYAHGRPDAPFAYTNMWGNCLAILLPWLLVGGWFYATSRRQRLFTLAAFALAFIPVVASLDRGLWVGLGVAILYLTARLAARGKLAMLGVVGGVVALAGIVILFTPAQSIISQRLAHGQSNNGRVAGGVSSLQLGLASPIVGWGDTRHQAGSGQSIAIGSTANCKRCGSKSLGGDGQLENLLITTGLVGAGFYCAFFAYGIWRYRRDWTPYGMAGVLVLVLGFVFMFVYNATGPPLAFTMLAYALLWRNDQELNRAVAPARGGSGERGGALPGASRPALAGRNDPAGYGWEASPS